MHKRSTTAIGFFESQQKRGAAQPELDGSNSGPRLPLMFKTPSHKNISQVLDSRRQFLIHHHLQSPKPQPKKESHKDFGNQTITQRE